MQKLVRSADSEQRFSDTKANGAVSSLEARKSNLEGLPVDPAVSWVHEKICEDPG